MKKSIFRMLTAFAAVVTITACNQSAGSVKEAGEMLTSIKKWRIDQIAVNDAITFKDGKMQSQFGGVEFDRYMETVEIKPDGTFSGVFKGAADPFVLQWKAAADKITIGTPGAKAAGGEWVVLPAQVSKKAFTMTTESTAYDYPRMTKIALTFKAE